MEKICYNCGESIKKENETVEHIPAKNLYEGFGDEYKLNRITVTACYECNQKFSKVDQQVRDYLAVKTERLEQRKQLTQKGVRSIIRNPKWKDRAYLNDQGDVIAVDFSYDELKEFHIKNFKGLFFKKYGFPLPDDFKIDIITAGDEGNQRLVDIAQIVHGYMMDDKEFEYSGHPDIFKFVLKDMTEDEKGSIYESKDFEKLFAVTGTLVYHNDLAVVVFAAKSDYLDKIKPQ